MTISISLTGAPRRDGARRIRPASYFTVWAQRRELAKLSHTRLRDLGISPAEAAREAARPFWDLP